MMGMVKILQDIFGDSWRTATLGIVLILLAMPCLGVGILLTLSPSTLQAGIAITTQGGLMIATGGGFLMTRDDKASKVAHQESLDKIAEAERAAVRGDAQAARKIDAVHEVVQEVKEEVKSKS